jgi:NADPH:quinone reductase-like Zn-dependent oxidoreductase
MRAAVLLRHGGPDAVEVREWPDPVAGPGEVVVELRCAALNRRDAWCRIDPSRSSPPVVLGSDGAGVVAGTGEEVVILPLLGWGARDDAPAPDYQILGAPRDGTHAERVVVPAANVRPKPARLSWEEAAALPLAGLTAWRALVTRGGVGPGTRLLVTGAGGGVATFLVQMAAALGAEVHVTSSSPERIARAVALGAAGGFDRTSPDWPAEVNDATGGGVDVVVDSAGGPVWQEAIGALRSGGTLVVFGRTVAPVSTLDDGSVFYRQISIHGTTMGSPREFDSLLAHVAAASWRPVIDSVLPLAEAPAAHARLDESGHFGKIVLQIAHEGSES